MNKTLEKAKNSFTEIFGKNADAIYYAPGRVNLIGEHTDYNNGFVLPCAINRGTSMAVGNRGDRQFNVIALDHNSEQNQWQSELPIESDHNQTWSNYLRGVNEQFLKKNLSPNGMDIVVTGDIPLGAGLSSSASFCVAFATAINLTNRFGLSPTEAALLCQAAENEFVGCNCGIMDPLISVTGRQNHAMLIDCGNLTYKAIELPAGLQVIIVDSKVTRGLVNSEYNKRREQCEQAAKIMKISSLREADLELLEKYKHLMEDPAYRRARHVITENIRTLQAAESLQKTDYATLSRLMLESHASMRDDFEITTNEIDYLVEIISTVLQDEGGVRMTGGGFGGCVVALAPSYMSQAVLDTVEKHYFSETGLKAEIHLCVASSGARNME